MKNLKIENGGYTMDNTSGYTQAEIDAMNADLDSRLDGIEYNSDEYAETCKRHADEMAAR